MFTFFLAVQACLIAFLVLVMPTFFVRDPILSLITISAATLAVGCLFAFLEYLSRPLSQEEIDYDAMVQSIESPIKGS